MNKEELIAEIRSAFKNVKLEEGTGLWEAQGIDDCAEPRTMRALRKKDERDDWDKIPYQDLIACEGAFYFLDAKGMRFCLPKYLVSDIMEEQIVEEQAICSSEIHFGLSYKSDNEYERNRFSLFNRQQIQSVTHYLEYELEKIIAKHNSYSISYGSSIDTVYSDNEYIKLIEIVEDWKQILLET